MTRSTLQIILYFYLALGFGANATAQQHEHDKSPLAIPGVTKISAEHLIELIAADPAPMIIDSRIRGDREQGHIEGSISLPDDETNCASIGEIVPKLNHPTIYYCNGPKCGRSANAVRIAVDCGYSNIYWFRGGFEEWTDKNFPIIK